ncbi:MAG: hypothetical protein HOI95_04015, partial [Chromatiales bacterium]|nr:hypothetical protein [Chromatiales bacterium]
SEKDGNISCRYNRNWMMKAAQRGGGDFSVDDKELLDLIDELTHQNCLEFDFQPGDIQFANNYKILHGRAPHTPAQTDEQTRLLMRIWFDANNLGPWSDEAIVRYGIIQHGKLGWSAADTLDGLDDKTHYRRAIDNAPDLYHVSPNGLSSTRKDHADLG